MLRKENRIQFTMHCIKLTNAVNGTHNFEDQGTPYKLVTRHRLAVQRLRNIVLPLYTLFVSAIPFSLPLIQSNSFKELRLRHRTSDYIFKLFPILYYRNSKFLNPFAMLICFRWVTGVSH